MAVIAVRMLQNDGGQQDGLREVGVPGLIDMGFQADDEIAKVVFDDADAVDTSTAEIEHVVHGRFAGKAPERLRGNR